MEDITVKELEIQIRRAAKCASATLPAEQLTPLLDLALRAAANLPLVKRKRAHFQIDHLLDELEGAAFSATLSSVKPLPPA